MTSTTTSSSQISQKQNFYSQTLTGSIYFLYFTLFKNSILLSFCYEIPSEEDVYEKIRKINIDAKITSDKKVWFDFSNYPQNHPNFDKSFEFQPGI